MFGMFQVVSCTDIYMLYLFSPMDGAGLVR